MKICFLGAGALGSTLGGVLTEAGNEVWLVDRSQAHVDAINARGLRCARTASIGTSRPGRGRRPTASGPRTSSSCW